jgi:short-subunit dehydrogenase
MAPVALVTGASSGIWSRVRKAALGARIRGDPRRAEQVARESLAAFERGSRTIIPGAVIRWYMRVNRPAPVALKLRVLERMYRPGS